MIKTQALSRLGHKTLSSLERAKLAVLARDDSPKDFIKQLVAVRDCVEGAVKFSSDSTISTWLKKLDKEDGTKTSKAYADLNRAALQMNKALEAFEDSLAQ